MGARSGLTQSGERHAAAEQEPRSQASSEGARSEEGPGGEGRGGSSKLLRFLWSLLTPLCFRLPFVPPLFINKSHFCLALIAVIDSSLELFFVGREK